jgi:cbb3-type cytochrome oxidase maturation protein
MLSILYLIIPLSLIIVAVAVGIFFWAVRTGQFDDLEGPAHRVLEDSDTEDHPTVRRDDAER